MTGKAFLLLVAWIILAIGIVVLGRATLSHGDDTPLQKQLLEAQIQAVQAQLATDQANGSIAALLAENSQLRQEKGHLVLQGLQGQLDLLEHPPWTVVSESTALHVPWTTPRKETPK